MKLWISAIPNRNNHTNSIYNNSRSILLCFPLLLLNLLIDTRHFSNPHFSNFFLLFLLFQCLNRRFPPHQSRLPLFNNDLINQRNNYLPQYKQLEEQKLHILKLSVKDEITMQADEKNIRKQCHKFHCYPVPRVEHSGNQCQRNDEPEIL